MVLRRRPAPGQSLHHEGAQRPGYVPQAQVPRAHAQARDYVPLRGVLPGAKGRLQRAGDLRHRGLVAGQGVPGPPPARRPLAPHPRAALAAPRARDHLHWPVQEMGAHQAGHRGVHQEGGQGAAHHALRDSRGPGNLLRAGAGAGVDHLRERARA